MACLFDVIVLGAGVQGSSTAYYLARKAGVKEVLLLEQFSALHTRGSSHGNSRITRRAYDHPFLVKMMDEAYPMWSALEKESGTKLYEKTGILVFNSRAEDEASLETVANSLEVNNIDHQNFSAKEANEKYSNQLSLRPELKCVFEKDGGILMAAKAMACYQKMFVSAGGVLLDEHRVTEIIPGHEVTVRTTKATFRTNKLVITAGSWAADLLKTLGLEIPSKVLDTEAAYWKTDVPEHFSKENCPIFIAQSLEHDCHFYGMPIQEYPGLIKVCRYQGKPTHPDSRDPDSSPARVKLVAEFIRKNLKGVAQVPSIIEPCMFTMMPDGLPILDYHPVHSNIVIGVGFSGHGFKLSPVMGKILSELTLGLPPSYDLSPFRIGRF